MKKAAMALKPSFSVPFLVLSLFVLCFGLALSTQDPELEQCQHQCEHQERFTSKQKAVCIKGCQDYIAQKEELERAKKHLEEDQRRREGHNCKKKHKKKGREEESPYVFRDEHETEEGRIRLLHKFTDRSDHHVLIL